MDSGLTLRVPRNDEIDGRFPASDRRRAAGLDRGVARATMPPCWWRRPAPARPRGCRWCWRDEPWAQKARQILVLEPRRLAARAAAERMAQTLGERVGDTVGLRVRFGSKVSRRTRIEVVTEGIFTRLILDDPMLDGVAAVLFDEFHERSLDADLGLALARDVQQGLREDLRILVMSATIDGARVAKLLGDAPVIESEGRAFPVETRYLGRDRAADRAAGRRRDHARDARRAGSMLAFLPGAARNPPHRDAAAKRRTDAATDVVALYGALDGDAQDRAIAPAPPGRRKIVLATSIAETSLTIEGVRIVVDSGLARVPRYEPDVGLTRLETVRVSRAAADQRRGRAGRTEPGVCYRLWDEPQTASLEPFARPEILAADLSSFVLDLAAWGARPGPARLSRSAAARRAHRGARRCCASSAPSTATAASPTRASRCGACRCRRGSPAWWSMPAPKATRLHAAEIAAAHRRARPRRRRCRSRAPARRAAPRPLAARAGDARAMAQRWAEIAHARDAPAPPATRGEEIERRRPARARLSRAHRQEPRRRGGRVPARQRPRRQRRSGLAAGARAVSRRRRDRRHARRRAASCSPRRSRSPRSRRASPTASKRARRSRSMPRARACAGAGAAGSAPSRWPSSRCRSPPTTTPRKSSRTASPALGIDRLPWTKALQQWRDRVMFLRAREGEEWPDLSDAALAANRRRLARAGARRQDRARRAHAPTN